MSGAPDDGAASRAAGPANGSADYAKMANQETFNLLQRNRYTKAATAYRAAGIVDGGGNHIAPREQNGDGAGPVTNGREGNPTSDRRRASSSGAANALAGARPSTTGGDDSISTTEFVKRNLPQAQVASASISGYWAGTEDFQAQALDVINEHKRLSGLTVGSLGDEGPGDRKQRRPVEPAARSGESTAQMLDVTDRIRGYEKMREWVEAGLEGWKPELREILYPVFVHTFLDLVDHRHSAASKFFFADHRSEHSIHHHQELGILSSITSELHIVQYPLSMRFRTEKYSVNLSKGGFGLFAGWLSDLGLEGLWDVGKGSIRGKEAVRNIVHGRVKINVADTSTALAYQDIRHGAGLLVNLAADIDVTSDGFNAAQTLKLGLPPPDGKLRDERDHQIRQQAAAVRLQNGQDGSHVNGNGGAEPEATEDEMDGITPPVVDIPEENHDIPPEAPSSLAPTLAERLPHRNHNNYSLVDLDKEVKGVADRRKRIRLGPLVDEPKALGAKFPVYLSLPSVCAYTLFDGGEGVTSTAFSSDSSIFAAGSAESCIRVWDLKASRRATAREEHANGEMSRDANTKRRQETEPVTRLIGHSGPVYSLSFDPVAGSTATPKHLLSSSQDGTVRLWDLQERRNLVVYKGHSEPVWDVQWGPMGVYFATASRDRTARLWITDRVTPVRLFAGHLSDVDCLTFHPNSMYLATGSSDRTCRLWDVQRGECVRVFVDHDDAVNCVAISPDGRMLASACADNSIKLMDLHHGTVIKTMVGHAQTIQSLSFSAESSILVSGSQDCTVRCWDVKGAGGLKADQASGKSSTFGASGVPESIDLLATFKTKRTPVTSVHFTPRNLCMMAGTYIEDEAR